MALNFLPFLLKHVGALGNVAIQDFRISAAGAAAEDLPLINSFIVWGKEADARSVTFLAVTDGAAGFGVQPQGILSPVECHTASFPAPFGVPLDGVQGVLWDRHGLSL